jgi:sugar phosphate permease
LHRVLYMLGLVLAGEAIYALPFHVARFFRPTLLEVSGLTATELGAAQGLYGVVAMLAYFPGGPLADRFPARRLLAVSLWSTAAGGLYMATFPGYAGALAIWAFFGVTTILLFWAALIRVTRDWGGRDAQGRAYGLLDGGRGVLAAGMASLGVTLLGVVFPEGAATASLEEKERALRLILYGYTAVTALAGVVVWLVLHDGHPGEDAAATAPALDTQPVWSSVASVLRMPAVWMQAIVILCAYVGYKGFDQYSLYAVQAWGLDPVEAASIVALGAWVRPVAALAAGLVGDRISISRAALLAFLLLLASHVAFALVAPRPNGVWLLAGNTLVTCVAIFGLRGLYFALFEEARVPGTVTGTAVGIVSVIGYTPDVFVAYVAGRLIDGTPGVAGFQHMFWFLAAFSLLGVVVSLALMRRVARARRRIAST